MDSITRQFGLLCLGVLAAALTACASNNVSQCEATGILCPAGSHCAAAQPICISDTIRCGDAHKDTDEECDDGNNIDGDGCSHQCTIEVCGNKRLDPGERCDDGNTVSGDGCSADCKSVEICGNGIIDTAVGEVCDDGNTKSGDGCSADCKSTEVCGNGIKDIHEKCDDGGKPGGCNDDCQGGTGCGDGAIDKDPEGNPVEECDDGNTDNTDDCVACRISRCGDGFKQSTGNRPEACDGSSEPGLAVAGGPVLTANCNLDCTVPSCGDKIVNPLFTPPGAPGPEQCDPPDPAHGCSPTCQFEHCGNGIKDPEEECDGNDFGPGGANGQTCAADCHIQKCGNGRIDPGEQCDDANSASNDGCSGGSLAQGGCKIEFCGDGITNDKTEECDGGVGGIPTATLTCNANCKLATCGDGIVNPQSKPDGTHTEQCDNGTVNGVNQNKDTAACTSTCQINVCGDGKKLEGVEQCDSSGVDTDKCDVDCTVPVCGDGHRNMAAGEACDDGALNGTAASPTHCNQFCQKTGCGDGILDFGEDCDAGSGGVPKNSAACNSDCTFAKCGDGFPNPAAGEACDEGATNGTLPGPTHCNQFCQFNSCGNGILEPGEQCDDGKDDAGQSKNKPGARCNATCQLNVCGDGDTLMDVEDCDPGRDDQGHNKDSPTCDRDCTAVVCGDGVTNKAAGEQCDDGKDNGTSNSINHCDSRCQSNLCGNGVVDFNEECDDGDGVNPKNSAHCNSDCKVARCGDGFTNDQFFPDGVHKESCDDGPGLNGIPCPYGNPFCSHCNATCTGNVSPGGPFCGDFITQTGFEQCDPGTGPGASSPSDPPSPAANDSATCNIDCTPLACGDGKINSVAGEQCDNFNDTAHACGTCSGGCNAAPSAAVAASATIAVSDGATIEDGNSFTLDDGFGTVVTFQFHVDTGGGGGLTTATTVSISFVKSPSPTGATDIATSIVKAINTGTTGFFITASVAADPTKVVVTNTRRTIRGNTTITRDGLPNFDFGPLVDDKFHMAGGIGGNCDLGPGATSGCNSPDDCSTNACNTTTHKCQ